MLNELDVAQQHAQSKLKEYKTLIPMAIGIFKKLAEVETMTDLIKKKSTFTYQSTSQVDAALQEHQTTAKTVSESTKIARREADQLINRLRNLVIHNFRSNPIRSCFVFLI